ncbi:uncharacterized protein PITG_13113 [Phytophthora infestans T30-4]|uniref:Uncharacterized protein n=1 Tax=Phytophthora infestans (strain T30-4) TaxID=403677 RepID=D0NKB6_PHYIT|nr:uncharacterized protein PITG_13113 [Phytophthora infestans T30-4]EEY59953.1 conserved hypothetical protein [Phytophthora infestans T30-4]|eukprot:XP_002900638.1 conserved hypothetical protein [Phytophthora infestans T30-4]
MLPVAISVAGMYTLPLLLLVSLYGVDSWAMRTVTSYQARVETYAPVWDDDNQVYVSGIPDSVSSSGNLTFDERYRATMDSITTSSIEGALMYLQRDCIDRGSDPTDESVNCERKNNVSVITFLEVQIVQPNVALAEYQEQKYMYPEFCPFVAMEDGECAYADVQDNGDTSSDSSSSRQHPPECKQFNGLDGQPNIGPCVGAQAFSADMVAPYYDTVWFSYPNSCVTSSWKNRKSESCREQYPGGLCPLGTDPDGVKCTFSYKILGFLSIDQLVGITEINATSMDTRLNSGSGSSSSSAIDNVQKASSKYYKNFNIFCKAGNIEFHSYDQDKTLGLNNVTSIPFWESPSSLEANIARTEQTIALYNALADESTNHMQKLPTDLEALRERNPPCYENAEVCYKAQFGCRRHSYAQWHLRHIGGTNRCHLKY